MLKLLMEKYGVEWADKNGIYIRDYEAWNYLMGVPGMSQRRDETSGKTFMHTIVGMGATDHIWLAVNEYGMRDQFEIPDKVCFRQKSVE